jgi:hypothetical protein
LASAVVVAASVRTVVEAAGRCSLHVHARVAAGTGAAIERSVRQDRVERAHFERSRLGNDAGVALIPEPEIAHQTEAAADEDARHGGEEADRDPHAYFHRSAHQKVPRTPALIGPR